MKTIFLLLFCILLNHTLTAQKVEVDKAHRLTVDGQLYAFIEKDGCGFGSPTCGFTVQDSSGKKVLVIRLEEFNDLAERKPSNTQGRVTYLSFVFLESKQKAEIGLFSLKTEKVAKMIVKNELFKDGKLNQEAVDNFVLINGTPFSKRRENRF